MQFIGLGEKEISLFRQSKKSKPRHQVIFYHDILTLITIGDIIVLQTRIINLFVLFLISLVRANMILRFNENDII